MKQPYMVQRQARRLALYIYWNVKGSQDRCAALSLGDIP